MWKIVWHILSGKQSFRVLYDKNGNMSVRMTWRCACNYRDIFKGILSFEPESEADNE